MAYSVKQRSENEWMLDPVIIADTYGASDGREVLFHHLIITTIVKNDKST
jgi:hypothetical protein